MTKVQTNCEHYELDCRDELAPPYLGRAHFVKDHKDHGESKERKAQILAIAQRDDHERCDLREERQ